MGGSRKKRGGEQWLPAPVGQEQHDGGRGMQSRPSASAGVAHVSAFELRKGPIPDAEELARYGRAHPDAPATLLEEFRRQGAHRRDREREVQRLDEKAMEAAIFSERMGVVCALLIAMVGFGCATYLVATDHGVAGTVMFGLDVGALVSAFILGRPQPDVHARPQALPTEREQDRSR